MNWTTEFPHVAVCDIAIDGPHGQVSARHYRLNSELRPGLVWIHGGAYVGGDLDMPEAHWVALSLASAGVPVVSVGYRKARHGVTFPVPADDVVAAWLWVSRYPRELGIDPAAVHLGGASAGAHLSAEVALRLRDESQPQPRSLIFAYGPFHPVLPRNAAVLERTRILPEPEIDRIRQYEEIHAHYAGPGNLGNERAFPALAPLAGLPPAYFLNSDIDDLRASAQAFAASIVLAGGAALSEVEPLSRHGHLRARLKTR
jgi:acetyl esterase/lipase